MILLNRYVLPAGKRWKFRGTYGKVITSYDELDKDYTKLITVGDYVSYLALKGGLVPDLLIYDGKTKRSEETGVKRFLGGYAMDSTSIVRNAAGTISEETLRFFSRFRFDKKTKLCVYGEEDLLAILAVLHAPENSMVVYGVPGKGMRCVKVDDNARKVFKEALDNLELIKA